MEYTADHQVEEGDEEQEEEEAPLSYVHRNSVKRFLIRFKAPKPSSPATVASTAATHKGKKPMMINSMEKGFSTNDDTSCDLCKKRFESLKHSYFHLKKKHSSNGWKTIFMSGSSENYKEHNAEEEVVDLRNCMRGNWGAVKKRKRGAGRLAGLRSSSEIAADDDDNDEEVRNAAMNLMHLIKASHDHRYSNRRSNSSIMGEAAASSSSICAPQRKQRIVFYAGDVEKAAEALLLLPRNADHPSSMAEAESSSSGNVDFELNSELVESLYDGLEVVRHSFDLNQPPPMEEDHHN